MIETTSRVGCKSEDVQTNSTLCDLFVEEHTSHTNQTDFVMLQLHSFTACATFTFTENTKPWTQCPMLWTWSRNWCGLRYRVVQRIGTRNWRFETSEDFLILWFWSLYSYILGRSGRVFYVGLQRTNNFLLYYGWTKLGGKKRMARHMALSEQEEIWCHMYSYLFWYEIIQSLLMLAPQY